MGKREFWIFIAIIGVAVFFRFYQLASTPPGLWPDEAANGVDALKTLSECQSNELLNCVKAFKIFYPANNGREGLFINLQTISVAIFGSIALALRLVSAIIGILTVIGLYFLTRYIFNWRIAAIASFFLAVSFWHVNFSRIGFRAIMLPFILVWGFYFLWRGLRTSHLKEFFIAGLIGGLGFYTYFSFRIVPLLVLIVFGNYWNYLKHDFSLSKYEHTKNQLLRGFALLMLTTIIMAIPLGIYFYTHPGDFLKREGRSISVFDQEYPLQELILSTVKTLGMFNFTGDYNQRHNIPGWPELSLPIGIFFIAGFLKELKHWLSRKHGHLSTLHTFLFGWFFTMLIPGFLSTEAPHALRVIGVVPVVMIFAARGFWWIINLLSRLYRIGDPHYQFDKAESRKEIRIVTAIAITIVLIWIGSLEYSRYFKTWGASFSTKEAFAQRYIQIAEYLNKADPKLTKYVLVNEGDVVVDGLPNNAQTIKFLTETHSQKCSAQKYIYYLRPDQLASMKFPQKYIIIPLTDSTKLQNELFWRLGLYPKKLDLFTVYTTNY